MRIGYCRRLLKILFCDRGIVAVHIPCCLSDHGDRGLLSPNGQQSLQSDIDIECLKTCKENL